ncbi:MAG: hypothetical protein J6P00_07150 [Acetobacter sp.]|nr:hypothetical protein [Acetobacter sp.]
MTSQNARKPSFCLLWYYVPPLPRNRPKWANYAFCDIPAGFVACLVLALCRLPL